LQRIYINLKHEIMKRISFAIFFACCTLALAAQDAIRVNYQGARPTITDFAWAYLFSDEDDEDECDQEATAGIELALSNYRQGLPQEEGTTLTVDEKNGYILYEWKYENTLVRIEMCYWNESDQKHKLFAYNYMCYDNGRYSPGQYDGLTFYRYDNATKTMRYTSDPGVDAAQKATPPSVMVSFSLPRSGKDIVMTRWMSSGTKQQQALKWNGHGFSAQKPETETQAKNDDIDYSSGPEYNQDLRELVDEKD
jgi:hypothetical protein